MYRTVFREGNYATKNASSCEVIINVLFFGGREIGGRERRGRGEGG
jgi:hypothetical protein